MLKISLVVQKEFVGLRAKLHVIFLENPPYFISNIWRARLMARLSARW
jgi:hypothetical protein